MSTLDRLTELIDMLPDSVTRANLLVVRGALRSGTEDRLHAVLAAFARAEVQRLETVIGKPSDPSGRP